MPERPSKKQFETLDFIGRFINEHGYGPSYREIMKGCNYSSVATVALHVDNLIKKGHLRKKDNSARSLEVVGSEPKAAEGGAQKHSDWLIGLVKKKFDEADKDSLGELEALTRSLNILGFNAEAQGFAGRLEKLRQEFL